MKYDKLIRDSWTLTWRHRFLWILGVLAGGGVSLPAFNWLPTTSGQSTSAPPLEVPPALAAFGQSAAAWALANIGLLVSLGILLTGVLLVLLVISFVAKGGMARATADLATGHPSSLGRAWRAGVHCFWRYVGLWLVVVLAALVVAILVAAVAAVLVGLFLANGPVTGIAVGAIVGLPLLAVLIVGGVCASIIVEFAQRAIAVEDVGAIGALRSGYSLMRLHLGESALTWVINFGLTAACGAAYVAGLVVTLIVLGAVGVAIFAMAGIGTVTIAYIGLGGLLLLLGGLLVSGISNTFFWNYWTLAYLNLSGRTTGSFPALLK
jgi:hypothetical protein